MKKVSKFIPGILWLIVSIGYFIENDLKKGILFMVCGVGWIVVEKLLGNSKKE